LIYRPIFILLWEHFILLSYSIKIIFSNMNNWCAEYTFYAIKIFRMPPWKKLDICLIFHIHRKKFYQKMLETILPNFLYSLRALFSKFKVKFHGHSFTYMFYLSIRSTGPPYIWSTLEKGSAIGISSSLLQKFPHL